MIADFEHLINWLEFHLVYRAGGQNEYLVFLVFIYLLGDNKLSKCAGQAFLFWVVYCFVRYGQGVG